MRLPARLSAFLTGSLILVVDSLFFFFPRTFIAWDPKLYPLALVVAVMYGTFGVFIWSSPWQRNGMTISAKSRLLCCTTVFALSALVYFMSMPDNEGWEMYEKSRVAALSLSVSSTGSIGFILYSFMPVTREELRRCVRYLALWLIWILLAWMEAFDDYLDRRAAIVHSLGASFGIAVPTVLGISSYHISDHNWYLTACSVMVAYLVMGGLLHLTVRLLFGMRLIQFME